MSVGVHGRTPIRGRSSTTVIWCHTRVQEMEVRREREGLSLA